MSKSPTPMKDYKVRIPLVIDGKEQIKTLIVQGRNTTEAYLAGVAWFKQHIIALQYPESEE